MVEYNPKSPYFGLSDSEAAAKRAAIERDTAVNARARESGGLSLPGQGAATARLIAQRDAANEATDAARPPKNALAAPLPPTFGSHRWWKSPGPNGGPSPASVSDRWGAVYDSSIQSAGLRDLSSSWGRPVSAQEAESLSALEGYGGPGSSVTRNPVREQLSRSHADPANQAAAIRAADAQVPEFVQLRGTLDANGVKPGSVWSRWPRGSWA